MSIGYNAYLIAQKGQDEHGQSFPVYFKAFGEFKNPLYIYAVSLIFKIFGISEFGLRATSFLFFFLFLLGFYLLVTDLFSNNRVIPLYALVSAGFLPWFFTLSRISFEVISQLTVVAFALLFIYKTYQPDQTNETWLYPSLAGLCLGLSVYTYSTSRLISFLMLFSLLGIFGKKDTAKKTLILLSWFICSLIPYIVFSINNPGALTVRFRNISYLYDPSLSIMQTICAFAARYLSYFGPDFLLLSGDRNLRHATGHGGEVLLAVFLLFLPGLISLAIRKELVRDKYLLFLFTNMLCSPAAASLTSEGTGETHALRSILLGLYILIFSCYGLACVLRIKSSTWKRLSIAAFFVLLLVQISLYVSDYFTRYADESMAWFETYDIRDTLIAALGQQPKEIIISDTVRRAYILPAFYGPLIANARDVPFRIGKIEPGKNTCVIYPAADEALLDTHDARFTILNPHGGMMKARCYF